MPDELSISDILDMYKEEDWMDRTVLANLLRAFAVAPSGKRIHAKGGRPAVLYPAQSVFALVAIVTENRGKLPRQ